MKRIGLAAATLALGLVLTGCNANPGLDDDSQGNTLGETTKGGTLNIFSEDPDIDFDPGKSQGLAITSLSLVHRRLTTWDIQPDKPGKVVPDLATDTGRVSDDGKTWTFTLKDGLKYETGDPITTKDIKYGIERSFSTELSGGLSYHKGLLEGGAEYQGPFKGEDLKSIETPDDKTIVFRLNSSFGDFPWIVSMPAFSPCPRARTIRASTVSIRSPRARTRSSRIGRVPSRCSPATTSGTRTPILCAPPDPTPSCSSSVRTPR